MVIKNGRRNYNISRAFGFVVLWTLAHPVTQGWKLNWLNLVVFSSYYRLLSQQSKCRLKELLNQIKNEPEVQQVQDQVAIFFCIFLNQNLEMLQVHQCASVCISVCVCVCVCVCVYVFAQASQFRETSVSSNW